MLHDIKLNDPLPSVAADAGLSASAISALLDAAIEAIDNFDGIEGERASQIQDSLSRAILLIRLADREAVALREFAEAVEIRARRMKEEA